MSSHSFFLTDQFPVIMTVRNGRHKRLWERLLPVFQKFCCRVRRTDYPSDVCSDAKTLTPDIIVIEWDKLAPEYISHLKADHLLFRTPVLVACDSPHMNEVALMIRCGATDCLQSSTPSALLEARILSSLKLKRLMDRVLTLMQEQARRDSLTGLWNHGHFFELLKSEIQRSRQRSSRLGVLMLDLDHFKKINDQYGHPIGDEALQEIIRLIRSALREGDVICRYGGEEFTIIVPETDRPGLFSLADRIRQTLNDSPFTVSGVTIRVSVSVGIAVYPEDADRLEELVQAADMALYQAKRMGRDRTESVKRIRLEFPTERLLSSVGIGGDFNAWLPERTPMTLLESAGSLHLWYREIVLPTGRVRYKFRTVSASAAPNEVEWLLDPANPEYEIDNLGQKCSILTINESLRQ